MTTTSADARHRQSGPARPGPARGLTLGIGKSRVVQSLREDIADLPHTWLETSGTPEFADTLFYAWSELLRQLRSAHADGVLATPRT